LARAAAIIFVKAAWVCLVSPYGAVTLLRRWAALIGCFFEITGMPSTVNGFASPAPVRVSFGAVVAAGFAVAEGDADGRDGDSVADGLGAAELVPAGLELLGALGACGGADSVAAHAVRVTAAATAVAMMRAQCGGAKRPNEPAGPGKSGTAPPYPPVNPILRSRR